MASVKFFTRYKTETAKIYIRFSVGREIDYKATTPLVINYKYFNNQTGKVRKVASYSGRDAMELQLNNLETFLIDRFNKDFKTGKVSGSSWLKQSVADFFNVTSINDLTYLTKYAYHYVDKLKIKRNDKTGTIGVAKATLTKYTTIAHRLTNFEKYKLKKYRLTDVNTNFRNDFLTYMLEVEKLGRNTAGRYIKFLKTVCLDAQKSGYKVSPELAQIKGFTVKVDKIYLSFDELQQIENTAFEDKHLQDAKDWLLIGCYIGQRVGDLLNLTKRNIRQVGNLDFIELTQQKTNKKVSILIHPNVAEILEKRNGNFPDSFGNKTSSAIAIFNKHLKEVARFSKLNRVVDGAKVNPKTNRKESGRFPKHELITSHICRRSFATNYYGEMPTALIMAVTGHATEKEFLNYIGKTNIDYAEQMAKYWNMQSQKGNIKTGKQTPLRVAK